MRNKLVLFPFALAFVAMACEWDPSHPLEHYAGPVDDALAVLDAGDAAAAATGLGAYLDTNQCSKGQIAISHALEEKARAGLDLGLVLFRIAESYGKRLTEDERNGEPTPERSDHVTCALAVVRALAESGMAQDRARAAFVEGNLLFFNGAYKEAVLAYDRALVLAPPTESEPVPSMGADVAFNRAIALLRSKEEPDAGPDGGDDDASSGDASSDDAAASDGGAPNDASSDDGADSSSPNEPDADAPPPDSGSPPPPQDQDAGGDDGGTPPPPPPPEDMGDAGLGLPPPEALDRLLDELERAPTVQQEIIRRERHRRMRPEEDK